MGDCKTLREVCESIGVTRRAVQGYEKAGLVIASGRNEYGYLLYDECVQKRIEQIKLYQQLGFSVKEIKSLIDAPSGEVKKALKRQVLQLKEDRERIDALIGKVYELLEDL